MAASSSRQKTAFCTLTFTAPLATLPAHSRYASRVSQESVPRYAMKWSTPPAIAPQRFMELLSAIRTLTPFSAAPIAALLPASPPPTTSTSVSNTSPNCSIVLAITPPSYHFTEPTLHYGTIRRCQTIILHNRAVEDVKKKTAA